MDLRAEALHLAVDLHARRPHDDFTATEVVNTASTFTEWLLPGEAPMHRWPGNVTGALASIQKELAQINRRLDHMSDQQAELNTDVVALTASLTDVAAQTATLSTDLTSIAEEITSLKALVAAGTTVDLSALTALVTSAQTTQSGLDTAVGTATAMVPVPAPPVETPPAA